MAIIRSIHTTKPKHNECIVRCSRSTTWLFQCMHNEDRNIWARSRLMEVNNTTLSVKWHSTHFEFRAINLSMCHRDGTPDTSRWHCDETDIKMAGKWTQLCVTDADSHAKNLVVTSGQSLALAIPYTIQSMQHTEQLLVLQLFSLFSALLSIATDLVHYSITLMQNRNHHTH